LLHYSVITLENFCVNKKTNLKSNENIQESTKNLRKVLEIMDEKNATSPKSSGQRMSGKSGKIFTPCMVL
jgi:hypothetical protein